MLNFLTTEKLQQTWEGICAANCSIIHWSRVIDRTTNRTHLFLRRSILGLYEEHEEWKLRLVWLNLNINDCHGNVSKCFLDCVAYFYTNLFLIPQNFSIQQCKICLTGGCFNCLLRKLYCQFFSFKKKNLINKYDVTEDNGS